MFKKQKAFPAWKGLLLFKHPAIEQKSLLLDQSQQIKWNLWLALGRTLMQ